MEALPKNVIILKVHIKKNQTGLLFLVKMYIKMKIYDNHKPGTQWLTYSQYTYVHLSGVNQLLEGVSVYQTVLIKCEHLFFLVLLQ
jgi:hypothetical protein